MSRVLFVDTWSHGRFFTDEVAKEMTKYSEIYFLHADKFYEIEDAYSGDFTTLVECDLVSYGMSFNKALTTIGPDVVIFISMHGIFHRWVNQICQLKGIKTLFFMHGVRFVRNEGQAITQSKSFFSKIVRAWFYLKHWYYLFKDLVFIKNTPRFTLVKFSILFKSFFEMFLDNQQFSDCPKYKWGLIYDVICVNTKYDYDYFKKFVGIENIKKLVISGHLTSRRAAINSLQLEKQERNTILFISQPLVSAGYISMADYLEVLLFIKEQIDRESNSTFVVRPHPRDDAEFIESLKSNNFELSVFTEFSDDLARAKMVIGFNSSALLGCMDVGLPVGVVSYGCIPLLDALKNYENSFEIDFTHKNNDLNCRLGSWLRESVNRNSSLVTPKPSEKIIGNEILSLINLRDL